jgi:hypothetical protein
MTSRINPEGNQITVVTGEAIQLAHELEDAASEINSALAAGSLMSVNSARGGEFWINPSD